MNSNNENRSPLDILMMLLYCLAILLIWAILFTRAITAHAQTLIDYSDKSSTAEGKFYSEHYSFSNIRDYSQDVNDYTLESFYEIHVASSNPIFAVKTHDSYTDDRYNVYICTYCDGEATSISNDNTAYLMSGIKKNVRLKDSAEVWKKEWGEREEPLTFLQTFTIWYDGQFNFSGYIFDSHASAKAYYENGDKSGIIQWPEPDYDYDHDFREDVYDPDIPVPEISNPSYNGFHVDNADPTRDIEIYIEATFYGLKHVLSNSIPINTSSSVNSSLYFQPDNGWKYAAHRYNLINTDISYSDADIDLLKMYKVDIVSDFTRDFKNWSSDYSSHKKLPDYSFLKHGDSNYNTYYKNCHLYSSSVGSEGEGKLKVSGQASVTYFVRFCQYVPGEGYTWGKWIAYTYTGRTAGVNDDLVIGDQEADPDTGKPNITNPRPGKVDPDTGDVDYGNGAVNIDSSDLWATIKKLVNDMGIIPEIIGEVLSFLPSWVLYMIAVGIAACVILRFVGR